MSFLPSAARLSYTSLIASLAAHQVVLLSGVLLHRKFVRCHTSKKSVTCNGCVCQCLLMSPRKPKGGAIEHKTYVIAALNL